MPVIARVSVIAAGHTIGENGPPMEGVDRI
jgi:hypothetical protein